MEEIVNQNIQVYNVPTDPISAGVPVHFHLSSVGCNELLETKAGGGIGPSDYYGGGINIGLPAAPGLFEIPVTIYCPGLYVEKAVDKTEALEGDELTCVITVTNSADVTVTEALMVDYIPANTTYVTGSVSGGAVYVEDGAPAVVYEGEVGAHKSKTFSFKVTLDEPTPDGTMIVNSASVDNGWTTERESNEVTTLVKAAILVNSQKLVSSPIVEPGGVVTFTILVKNTASATATVVATDTLPAELEFETGSETMLSGPGTVTYDAGKNAVIYQGTLGAMYDNIARFRFAAKLKDTAPRGTVITNKVYIADGKGTIVTKSASFTVAKLYYYLPLMYKNSP